MNTSVTMHFTIEELYASKTAKEKGINNKPNMQQMINLVYLAAFSSRLRNPLPILMGSFMATRSGSKTYAAR